MLYLKLNVIAGSYLHCVGRPPGTRILKQKKLKINLHRPVGTRVVFDEEGNTLPPLARLADVKSNSDSVQLDKDKGKYLGYQMLVYPCIL